MKVSDVLREIERVGENRYRIPRMGDMQVEVCLYLSEGLRRELEGDSLLQLVQAACLPGLYRAVIGMPDLHLGYGLPIGGIMASRAEYGVVSAGAVGMDINCGVRLMRTGLAAADLDERDLRHIMQAIRDRVPVGLGKESRRPSLYASHFEQLLRQGARKVVELGYGCEADLEFTEENGCLDGADPSAVSRKARERGDQFGTIGAGNHFIDICEIDRIYDRGCANRFNLHPGQLVFLIHTGSRGFGHQVCTDYMEVMAERAPGCGIKLPTKGLASLPVNSNEGRRYLAAMACAVNFAFANRQLIAHEVREACSCSLGLGGGGEAGPATVYDVAHNIAKWEEHFGNRLLIHRKGAVRALPAGHGGNPRDYMDTGHPVLIPGTMGTSSYVVVGTGETEETFFSVNHGAGRVMSRKAAKKSISTREFEESLDGIVYDRSLKKMADEAPQAYKDIDEVVDTLADIGLTRKVARMRPLAVISR